MARKLTVVAPGKASCVLLIPQPRGRVGVEQSHAAADGAQRQHRRVFNRRVLHLPLGQTHSAHLRRTLAAGTTVGLHTAVDLGARLPLTLVPEELETGHLHAFGAWENATVPAGPPGVY